MTRIWSALLLATAAAAQDKTPDEQLSALITKSDQSKVMGDVEGALKGYEQALARVKSEPALKNREEEVLQHLSAGYIAAPRAVPVATAAVFTVERFVDGSRTLFPRYLRLGCALMVVYVLSGLALLVTAFGEGPDGLLVTAAASIVFVLWITAVNLLYLLAQIVMAAEGCGVGLACRRALGFVRRVPRTVLGVCVVTLGLVVLATAASLVAATALGLIGFVPFVGLAVLPLQLLAWVLRGLVLQYIALASVGAYSTLYRGHAPESSRMAGSVAVRPMGAEAS